MASGITVFGANRVLDVFFGRRASAPGDFWLALVTASPGEHADGSLLLEPDAAAGYARVQLLNDPLHFGAAAGGVLATTASVVFPTAVVDWPVCTGYALCDAQVDGNVYLFGDFTLPRRVPAGDAARIGASTLTFSAASLSTALTSAF